MFRSLLILLGTEVASPPFRNGTAHQENRVMATPRRAGVSESRLAKLPFARVPSPCRSRAPERAGGGGGGGGRAGVVVLGGGGRGRPPPPGRPAPLRDDASRVTASPPARPG